MKRFQVLFILAALFAMACSSGGGKGPGEVYQDAMMKLADGQYDVVMGMMTMDDDAEELSGEEKEKTMAILGMAHGQIQAKGGIKEFTILEEVIAEDGLSAVVKFEVVFGDGDTSEDEATMLKVDGKWLMKGF